MENRWVGPMWVGAGVALPIAVSAALIPARDWLGVSNVALVLMVVVVGISASGNRLAASLAAVSSALAFDVMHTVPYGSLTIDQRADAVTFACLLVAGLLVAQVATWGRRQRTTAERSISDVAILRSVAELTSSGEDPEYVVITTAYWLRELLELQDCRFEYDLSPMKHALLTSSGEIKMGDLVWDTEEGGMPDIDIDLVITGKGKPLGRFVLTPTPRTRVTPDRLLTSVALADQVGSCLANGSSQPEPST